MEIKKSEKNITIIDDNNIINYYKNKKGFYTRLSAILVINDKEKHYIGKIDFKTMLSTWSGKDTRMTNDTLSILEKYDKLLN